MFFPLLENLITVGLNINQGEAFKRNVQEEFMRAKRFADFFYTPYMTPYIYKYELN